jgi:hypothetical protein
MREWSPDGSPVRPHPASGHGPILWPSPDLIADDLPGRAGQVVGTSDLHPDADREAVLLSLPMACGSAVGNGLPVLASATRHPARLPLVVVGEAARAGQRDAVAAVRLLMAMATPELAESPIRGGLSGATGISAVPPALSGATGIFGCDRHLHSGLSRARARITHASKDAHVPCALISIALWSSARAARWAPWD